MYHPIPLFLTPLLFGTPEFEQTVDGYHDKQHFKINEGSWADRVFPNDKSQ